jgi:hypothetical protein
MKKTQVIIGFLSLFLCALVLFSGCLSSQNDDGTNHPAIMQTPITQPSAGSDSPQSTTTRYSIKIDPIRDFKTDASFNIIGSTKLLVRGTTDVPAGTMLRLEILDESKPRSLKTTYIEVLPNASGPNTFSSIYDVKGYVPGQYRVIIADEINLYPAISRFKITSDKPYDTWIRMDPPAFLNDRVSLSGATDLPAGSKIMIKSYIELLGCSLERESNHGYVTPMCKGECLEFEQVILVDEGTGKTNTWNLTANYTTACQQHYKFSVRAVNRTNVTYI